jgi:solute carrier family 13 (sodium-dependent dicarboxylate transporter), member 2/3/5
MSHDLGVPLALSPGEIAFDRWRRRLGIIAAPLAILAIALADFPALSPEAHRLAAVMAGVVILWISEALPMPVTALLGASACVVVGVAPTKQVFAPFADPLMFLFIGSFILAQGIFHHGLDKRMAYAVLARPRVAASPTRLLLAFGLVAAVVSGWISNTATTAMLFGIGLSMLRALYRGDLGARGALDPRWATGLMLMIAFAASIGGLATPIGTPPNVIGLGFIRAELGIEVPFFTWMLVGVPIVVLMMLALSGVMTLLSPAGVRRFPESAEITRAGAAALGPWTRGQRSVVIAFGVTVCLWVLPGILALALGERDPFTQLVGARIPEGVAAMLGALLLFVLPGEGTARAIGWREAESIEWGVVLLYGGGFALGSLAFSTGLAEALGRGLTGYIPGGASGLGLLVASTLVATLLSEATSNTASANMVVPVVIAIANAAGSDPFLPALGATMGASLGFALPVSTPCNAIVYGSGVVPLSRMIRAGLILDLIGVVVIVGVVSVVGPVLR